MEIREFTSLLKKIKRQKDGYIACCPAHDDKTPSLSIKSAEDGKILLHCFAGCDTSSILSTMKLTESDLFPQEKQKIIKKNSPTLKKIYTYCDINNNPIFEVCRYEPKDFRIRHFGNGGYIYGLGDIQPVLYNLPEASQADTVYICEGEKDADLLIAHGLAATTAPMGAGKWRESYTEQLLHVKKVVIIPDCDSAGKKHAYQIIKAMNKIPCEIIDLKSIDPSLPDKSDVSDLLKNHTLDELLSAPRIAGENYLTDNVNVSDQTATIILQNYVKNNFWADINKNKDSFFMRTGFPSLDKILGNTLSPGLYILGAVSSLGKSAFCSQLCDTWALQHHHVLFFSLEMSVHEMTARTLARLLFQHKPEQETSITTGDILRGNVDKLKLTEIIENQLSNFDKYITYAEGNFNIGVSQVRSICEEYKETYSVKPIVFIDYLQVLTPSSARLTDKQSVDYNVVELKRISRDLDIPIIAVSSLNRQNYNEELNFSAFKESGAIEYSADFVMGLQASGVSAAASNMAVDEKKLTRQIAQCVKTVKMQIPRQLEAVVLKNRRGEAMGKFELRYWPGQNWFEEG